MRLGSRILAKVGQGAHTMDDEELELFNVFRAWFEAPSLPSSSAQFKSNGRAP